MTSGTVFDIKRFALHDGPGTRVTVHLKGCPLSCLWCHNPEGLSSRPRLLFRKDFCTACGACVNACPRGAVKISGARAETDKARCAACGLCSGPCPANAREICGARITARDVVKAVLADEAFFRPDGAPDSAASTGGVTLSGGEPLAQEEFSLELLRLFGEYGIHRAIDTSGHVPERVILEAALHCELFLYDIKHMDTDKHREFTGAGNELILSNLRKLSERGSRLQIRVPFIPGINSGDENINAIADMVSTLGGISGVNILPYHKAAADKHRRWGFNYLLGETREPEEAELLHAVELFAKKGIAAIVGG